MLAQVILNNNLDCPNITGRLMYFNNAATPLYGAQAQLKTTEGQLLQTSETDYLGQYSFCQLTQGTYLISAVSSRTAGGINSTDALIALRHYVGQITLSGLKFKAADINNNGYVNSTDALMILRRDLGHTGTFPAGDWVFESNTIIITDDTSLVFDLKGLCYGDPDGSFTPDGCTPMPTPANAGPDQNIIGTGTTLEGNTPVYGTGGWTIVSGTGGSIAEPGNPLSIFNGIAGNNYTLVWTITTICTFSSDTVEIEFSELTFFCGSPFTDTRDGRVYNTVQIGTQCWMRENLNIGTMVISTTPGYSHSDCTYDNVIQKYCYDNNPANCDIYGGLYDWEEMMSYVTIPGFQEICPSGWHVPTDEEWCTLANYLDATVNCTDILYSGLNAGGKIKEAGDTHWDFPNTGATNESGFTAFAGGWRLDFGYFADVLIYGRYWSSSEGYSETAISMYLYYEDAIMQRRNDPKNFGYSVRCLRNN